MADDESGNQGNAEQALIDLAIEGWRFQKLFARALSKLDAGDAQRFTNQHRFFVNRLSDCLSAAGLKIVHMEGQPYETGSAITALNLSDFATETDLVIDQMIEPLVMNKTGVARQGTAILRKATT
jgi:hypothetical protein